MKNSMKIFGAFLIVAALASIFPQSSNAQYPDHPETNICRCKGDGCYGGNAISVRPRCGQGDCGSSNGNCYNPNDAEISQ